MKVNFVFIRHGESCQQVAFNNIRDPEIYNKFFVKFTDPTISDNGVIDSIDAGKQYVEKFSNGTVAGIKFDNFDIIGCSPMLRTIETAYFMTLDYKPEKIFVFPFLRECARCNETDTKEYLDTQWPLRSITEQQTYLLNEKITNIDFKHVLDNPDRESPGNIKIFMDWFGKNLNLNEYSKEEINVLIVTHSHVLKHFSREPYDNNAGFILKTELTQSNEFVYNHHNLSIWPKILRKKLGCPTKRCPGICESKTSRFVVNNF